jgi:hypothetical protein
VISLQTPEQQPSPASPAGHPSPDARHVALESSVQKPLSHDDEQHSSSVLHAVPTTLQIAPPQAFA